MLKTSLLPLVLSALFLSALVHAAEPPDLATSEMFWADGLDAIEKTETKSFTTSSHTDINFTSFSNVTNRRVEDSRLKFELTSTSATLGWGHCNGAQNLADVVDMWEEWNDIAIRIKGSGGSKTLTLSYCANGGEHPGFGTVEETLSGTDWTTVTFNQASGRPHPTPDGFELTIQGDNGAAFEIEWVKLHRTSYEGWFRKEFNVPAGEIWSGIADVAAATTYYYFDCYRCHAKLYINGQLVERPGAKYPGFTAPVDITSYLNPGQTNCVAFYGRRVRGQPYIYMQCRLIYEDGSEVDIATGSGWKVTGSEPGGAWNDAAYDDSGWSSAPIDSSPLNYGSRVSSWGLLLSSTGEHVRLRNPATSSGAFFYKEGEEVVIDAYVPQGHKTPTDDPVLHYWFSSADAEGGSHLISEADVTGFTQTDGSLKYQINLGNGLSHGVYSVAFELSRDGTVLDTRQREPFVVLREQEQIPISGEDYTEGLSYVHERTIDFTDPGETEWIEMIGPLYSSYASEQIFTANVVTRNGRTYRELNSSNRGSFFSYPFEFDHPGDFYLMELEYPDDDDRLIEVSISNRNETTWQHNSTQSGIGVLTGGRLHKTYEMQTLRWLHVAEDGMHSADILNGCKGQYAAAARLNIYHVTGGLPTIAGGSSREYGVHTERVNEGSGIGKVFGDDMWRTNSEKSTAESRPNMQRFIRDLCWLERMSDRYMQYLRFSGQNMLILGSIQYSDLNTPAVLVRPIEDDPRILQCMRYFLAHALEFNEINFYIGIEFSHLSTDGHHLNNNAQIANGAETTWMVNGDGEQQAESSASYNTGNWLHPAVWNNHVTLMSNVGEVYRGLDHFKGVHNLAGAQTWPSGYFAPGFIEGRADYNTELLGHGFDDATVTAFESETGIDLGVSPTATNRFTQRKNAIAGNGAWFSAFLAWRADKYVEFVQAAIDALQAQRADLRYLNANIATDDDDLLADWLVSGKTFGQMLHDIAFDMSALKALGDVWMGRWTISYRDHSRRDEHANYVYRTDPDLVEPYEHDEKRLVMCRVSWDENYCLHDGYKTSELGTPEYIPGSDWELDAYRVRIEPQPGSTNCREAFVQAMALSDPSILTGGFTDIMLNIGYEEYLRTFMKVVTQLPPERFDVVLDTDLSSDMVIRRLRDTNYTWIYVLNPGFWELPDCRLALDTDCEAVDLASGEAVTLTEVGGKVHLEFDLEPYGIVGFRLSGAGVEVEDCDHGEIGQDEYADLMDRIENARELLESPGVIAALTQRDRGFLNDLLDEAEAALHDGDYALVRENLKEIETILRREEQDVSTMDDHRELDIFQTGFAWVDDADTTPDGLAWGDENAPCAFVAGESCLLAVQMTLETAAAGDWVLEYQEDYDTDQPGDWTPIGSGAAWSGNGGHLVQLSNGDETQTGWYVISAPAGETAAANGEFSNDNNGANDSYDAGTHVELWYALIPSSAAHSHNYRFRIVLAGTDIGYRVYAEADSARTVTQASWAWTDDADADPGDLPFLPEGMTYQTKTGVAAIVAVQIACDTPAGGEWQLQVQEDTNTETPGAWTDVAPGAVWEPASSHQANIADGGTVPATAFATAMPAGYTPVAGVFSNDGEAAASFGAGDVAELWYAVTPAGETTGHSYRFRVVNGAGDVGYDTWPIAGTDLVLHLKLDDGSGTTPQDSSPYDNDGLFPSDTGCDPTWTGSGQIGGAVELDGDADYITVASSPSLQFDSEFTFCAWVKIGAGQADDSYIGLARNQQGDSGFWIYLSNGKPVVYIYDSGGINQHRVSSVDCRDGEWHFICVYTSPTRRGACVDGAFDTAPGHTYLASGQTVAFGGCIESWLAQYDMLGAMDDIRLYNRALTHDEITELANRPPVVDAGPDRTVHMDELPVLLNGTVSDDGAPEGGGLSVLWSQVSGPGLVVFADPMTEDTAVVFSEEGAYVLRLTADDTALQASDEVTVTVEPALNQPPEVNAGPDVEVFVTDMPIALDGTVTDDGLPAGVPLDVRWRRISGPALATFDNPAAVDTAVTLDEVGEYVLRLTADDSVYTRYDDVVITVDYDPNANNPPNAVDDLVETDEDTPVDVDVLANDDDPDEDPLTISDVTQPAHGEVVNNVTDVTYTPATDYFGTDAFTYTVSDGEGESDTATVNVVVNPINDAPVAIDDEATTAEDEVVDIDVLANDVDPDPGVLVVSAVTQPPHGTVVNGGSSVIYLPEPGFHGTDTFTYTVRDPYGATDTATVEVTVAEVIEPSLIAWWKLDETTGTLAEDSIGSYDGTLHNGLTFDAHSVPGQFDTALSFDGTDDYVEMDDVLDFPSQDFTISAWFYLPAHQDRWMYMVSKRAGGSTGYCFGIDGNNKLSLSWRTDSASGGQTLRTEVPTTGAWHHGVGVFDRANGELRVYLDGEPAGSDVAAGNDGSLENAYDFRLGAYGYSSVYQYCFQGYLDDVRIYLGALDDQQVENLYTGGSNQAPDAVNDTESTDEEVPVTIAVLANDSDPDEDPIEIVDVTQAPHGSVVIDGDDITYTPDDDFSGADIFTYTIGDGNGGQDTATVVVAVRPDVGSLQVALTPPDAVTAGAQWRLNGGPWLDDGVTLTDIAVGEHTVEYRAIAGWETPGSELVTIVKDQTTQTTGTYVLLATGSLQVTIEPEGARLAGAQWRLDGGDWQESGAALTALTPGDHTLSCSEVAGWMTPEPEVLTIADGLLEHTVTYYRHGDFDHNLVVDFWDFMAFVDVYGLTDADPGWNDTCVIGDFDQNGIIDFWDFISFVDVYGTDDR